MKLVPLKIIFCLMILALLAGVVSEAAYAFGHQDCSCCKDECHNATKCHNNVRVCSCNYQTIQSFLAKNSIFLNLIFSGYLLPRYNFTYIYQASDDIFHPPKAS